MTDKIVFIVGSLGIGGVQSNLLRLIHIFKKKYKKIEIICIISTDGDLKKQFIENGVEIHECLITWPAFNSIIPYRLTKFLRRYLKWIFKFRLALKIYNLKPDIIHTHIATNIGDQVIASMVLNKIPFIWTIHGLYKTRGDNIKDWGSALSTIIRQNGFITGVSRSALNELNGYSVPIEKTEIIPNTIKEFPNVNQKNIFQIPNVCNKQPGVIYFGSAGRLIDIKRFDILIKAFKDIHIFNLNVKLIIGGDGPQKLELIELVKALNLTEHVMFLGSINEMSMFFSYIDVFVLVSESESFSMVLVEAIMYGLPCICTNIGGIPEAISPSKVLFISPNSVGELVNAMYVMLDQNLRFEYINPDGIFGNKYSVNRIGSEYMQLYEKLLRH